MWTSHSTVLVVLVLRRVARPEAGFEMRSLEDFEDLDEAVFAGGVSGVDVTKDEFQPAFVEEALDEGVEVILVESAVSSVGFAHDVDDESAGFRQFDHLPKGGRRQMSLGEASSARQSVKLSHSDAGAQIVATDGADVEFLVSATNGSL